MHVRSYFLPQLRGEHRTVVEARGDVLIEHAQLDAERIGHVCDGLAAAAQRLRRRRVADLVATLDRVVERWLTPTWLSHAAAVLPSVTGYSRQMVKDGVPLMLQPLRSPAISAVLERELGDAGVLDQSRDGRTAVGVRCAVHVLAGNLPCLAAAPMVLALAVKSGLLLKSGSGDPASATLLAEAIAEEDPELAEAVAVAYWRGGDRDIETAALQRAELTVASGSDAAIAALRARVAGRFLGHGHKISFAVIDEEILRAGCERVAAALAYDVSLWDQQGCLSPQGCFIVTRDGKAVRMFAEALAAALDERARAWPPHRPSVEEQAAIRRFRDEAEWAVDGAVIGRADSLAWSIRIDAQPAFVPTCLNRCIRVAALGELETLTALLAPHRAQLEAAGIAADDADRRKRIVRVLHDASVRWVTAIGSMQQPPLTWPQSGRPRVADWLEWMAADG